MSKLRQLYEGVRCVLLDLDGTVYYGNAVIPGALKAIERCRDLGLRILFLTNNSALSRDEVRRKLNRMGIDCAVSEVVTGSYAAALLLYRLGADSVYVCGTDGLAEELTTMGVEVVKGDGFARYVAIGFDPRFDYKKLTGAVRASLRAETIVACNRERTFIGNSKLIFPGCGAMVAAIEWCANRKVDFVAGKPEPLLLETICAEYGYSPSDLLVVGDTYQSDIVMAQRFNAKSVLVGDCSNSEVTCIETIGQLVDLIKS